MLPVLVNLPFIKIYTFGVFLVLAFFWGSFLLWRNIRLTLYKEEDIFDGIFFSLTMGIFFGRLIYVLLHFGKFGFDILKFILINGYPGLFLYGVIGGSFLSLFIFCLPKKIKFFEVIDYFIAPILLSLGIGKLGSFFSGVEVGTKTLFILSIKYVNFEGFRHITALYEAILLFFGVYLSQWLLFSVRRGKYKKGVLLYFFFCYISLLFLLFDPLKSSRTFLYGYSLNMSISVTILLTFSVLFIYYSRNSIFKRMRNIKNYPSSNERKINPAIHPSSAKEVGGREEQNSSTNKKTETR